MNLDNFIEMKSKVEEAYRNRTESFLDLVIESKESGMTLLKLVKETQIKFFGKQIKDSIVYVTYSEKIYSYVRLRLEDFIMIKEIKLIEKEDDLSFYTKNSMKFDKIIMNPPYERSLHLKIVNECLDFITENGEIINLSTVRWLQDPLAEYKDDTDWKRFEKVRKSIYSLDIISNEKATECFQALIHGDLGIYLLNKKGGLTFTNKYKSIVEKVLNCEKHWEDVVEHNEVDGIRVKTQAVRNYAPSSNNVIKNWKKNEDCYHLMYKSYSCIFIDGMQNGKWWSEFGNKNKYTKEVGTPLVDSIKFKTVNEASNFENSCWTKFMLFCNKISKVGVHTNFGFLPFMPTYTHPWTDKDFYEYFDFTDDEINQIEEEMNDSN